MDVLIIFFYLFIGSIWFIVAPVEKIPAWGLILNVVLWPLGMLKALKII